MDFISILSIFVLACFVGYYVVWSVTPALHTPLMAVTNAISSVIIVGALIAAAAADVPGAAGRGAAVKGAAAGTEGARGEARWAVASGAGAAREARGADAAVAEAGM